MSMYLHHTMYLQHPLMEYGSDQFSPNPQPLRRSKVRVTISNHNIVWLPFHVLLQVWTKFLYILHLSSPVLSTYKCIAHQTRATSGYSTCSSAENNNPDLSSAKRYSSSAMSSLSSSSLSTRLLPRYTLRDCLRSSGTYHTYNHISMAKTINQTTLTLLHYTNFFLSWSSTWRRFFASSNA